VTTIAESLSLAWRFQSAGQLDQAARLYQQIVKQSPEEIEALRLLGVVYLKQGRPAEAEAVLQRLVRLAPGLDEPHVNLGVSLSQLGRPEEAVVHFREAVRLQPKVALYYNNLGNALRSLGQLDEAVAQLQQALRLRPNYPEALSNLALVAQAQGQFADRLSHLQAALRLRPDDLALWQSLADAHLHRKQMAEAETAYRRALRIDPNHTACLTGLGVALLGQQRWPEATQHFHAVLPRLAAPDGPEAAALHAEVHNFLGVALAGQGQLAEAVEHYRTALGYQPDRAAALSNLGLTLGKLYRHAEAIAALTEAVRLEPGFAEAHGNLGLALLECNRETEALMSLRRAIQLRPDSAKEHSNLGNVLMDLGRPDDARPCFEEALRLEPNNAECHKQIAGLSLLNGEWQRGWEEYEWRWRGKDMKPRNFPQPQWQGEPLAGRSILLHVEQGRGDTFQFIRLAPLVQQRGGRVIVESVAELLPLLRRCPGVDQWVETGQPRPAFDVHLPLLSLPHVLGTTLERVPAQVPYIFPEPGRVAHWRRELEPIPGFKVGVVWQGSPEHAKDRMRSLPLRYLAPLTHVPGVQLFSLQKGHGAEQLTARFWPIIDLGSHLADWTDTAAALLHLDLVISVDTAVAHLAGALAQKVWVALPLAPDWRWLRYRQDSPWYPTMRLFRQSRRGDWDGVCTRLCEALQSAVSEHQSLSPWSDRQLACRLAPTPQEQPVAGEGLRS
jgi:Flp pilus assembly protein TadD